MATMLGAGISILEVVDSLLEDAKGGQQKLLTALREDLTQGKHVYICFSRFPQVFDKVTVNIIKASEEAGTLDVTLRDLKQNIQKEIEFNDKVKAAMTYPAVIFLVFVGVLLMILVVVVPKISSVFLRMNVPLPLPTRVMIFTSDFLLKHTLAVIATSILTSVGFFLIYRNNRRAVLNIIFGLPLIRDLIKEIDLTRFTRSLYLLLSSGIPITSGLELTHDVVMRKDIAAMIDHTYQMVLSGKRISEGMKVYKGIVPTIMIKIIEAGEKTGTLDRSMQDISTFLDYQVTNTLRTLTALLEPIMLVFVGVMIGGMMLAIIAPIYGLIGQVGGH
ncbi:MAG: hypothetical protein RI947_1287 [Candidatus Parcubacteria bacterium]|jgi:type II secretory pathway component PulF